jgi:hypothetical protein
MLVSGDAGYCKNRKIKRTTIVSETKQNSYGISPTHHPANSFDSEPKPLCAPPLPRLRRPMISCAGPGHGCDGRRLADTSYGSFVPLQM